MFKKSRRKIVAAIMSVLVLLWVGTLGVIYTSSYIEMSKQNEMMLKVHAEMYTPTQDFDGIRPPTRPFPGGDFGFEPEFAESPLFQLSTFYTVAVTYSGETLEIRNSQPNLHSDKDLEELAEKIMKYRSVPIRMYNPYVPESLAQILDRVLDDQGSLYYQNAKELIKDLKKVK